MSASRYWTPPSPKPYTLTLPHCCLGALSEMQPAWPQSSFAPNKTHSSQVVHLFWVDTICILAQPPPRSPPARTWAPGHGLQAGGQSSSPAGLRVQASVAVAHRRRQRHPLRCSCLENSMHGGAWWAAAHGVAKSRTRLKWLSSSSSSSIYIFSRVSKRKQIQVFTLNLPIKKYSQVNF